MRAVLGRVRAFRHFCCPAEPEEQPEQQPQLQQLAQQQRRPTVVGPNRISTFQAGAAEPAAAAAACAPAGAGPLLAAAGPEARRALKRQLGPGEPLEVLPRSCAEVGLVAGVFSATVAAEEEPAATRRRLAFEPVVSPLFALQPYAVHKAAFVGRNLWCLDCFEVPGSAHRSWRHGRCGGAKPPTSIPPALRDSILRQPVASPKLEGSTRSRWTVLAAALGAV